MDKLQGFLKNGSNLVTVIGVIIIFTMVVMNIDGMYMLVVLGAMNCLYGLFAVITKKPIGKELSSREGKPKESYSMAMGVCQMLMGLFILVMGIVYIKQLVVGQVFWDIVLIGIVVLMVLWYVLRLHFRKI